MTGTVDDHVLRIEALRHAGVDHVIVALDDLWEPAALDRLGQLVAVVRGSR